MNGKICLITGGSSGIGKETVRDLARRGATLISVSRENPRGEEAVQEIRQESGNDDVHFFPADLAQMSEVRRLAHDVEARFDRLDVLVNNAGIFLQQRQETPDGFEKTLAVNHLAPFLLTALLLPRLRAAPAARIITVSSIAERQGTLRRDDLMFENSYSGWGAYGQSKLANLLFTYQLADLLKNSPNHSHITANALHPGAVATGFGRNNSGWVGWLFRLLAPVLRSPDKGSETVRYLATSPDVAGVSGQYFVDSKAKPSSKASNDQQDQAWLWDKSRELVGLSEDEADDLVMSPATTAA